MVFRNVTIERPPGTPCSANATLFKVRPAPPQHLLCLLHARFQTDCCPCGGRDSAVCALALLRNPPVCPHSEWDMAYKCWCTPKVPLIKYHQ